MAISPMMDKIVIIRKEVDHETPHDKINPALFIKYTLWRIDLKTRQAILLAESKDKDVGITYPVWSPDEKWIAFHTFSVGGHSPLTTMQTWSVDSSGNRLQHIKLPAPYYRFSNSIINWKDDHILTIGGL